MLIVFGLVVFAYLLGSVPSGWIVMKLYRGQDLRHVGSGNIGAANVFRAGGPGAFATTLAADGLKGVIPVLAGILLGYGPQEWVLALIGLAAVVGHTWPIFLGFHGGKGVATSGGVMLVLAPVAVVLSVVTWAILIRATKIASLSSLAAVGVGFVALLGLRVFGWQAWRPVGWWVIGLGVVLLALVVVRHRANISRLARGRELKITTPTT
jgi:acyl phosphate:glycerol-3-phosphate acyltransferase